MYEDLAEFAVKFASKNGASYVEARLEETNSNAFVLKNGGLEISGFEDLKNLTKFMKRKT